MPSPFPGMDPYLEHPADWPGFHHLLISAAARQLNQQLKPRGYYVNVEERVWLEEPATSAYPDVAVIRSPTRNQGSSSSAAVVDEPVHIRIVPQEIHEGYLEVFDAKGRRLVTGIEFISPSNKNPGKGRDAYEMKRDEWRIAGVHLVEVDLLRSGKHIVDVPREALAGLLPWDYLANIVRVPRLEYEVYPIRLRDRLPRVRVPLKNDEPDGALDLQEAVAEAYDAGPYPDRIDYDSPAKPPLEQEDAAWADGILRKAGLRTVVP